jgi:small GTP-binding protein
MKIVLVGETQVGKTSIVTRLVNDKFTSGGPATIGASFQNYKVATKNGMTSFQIWDTAGQEKFRSLAPMYYRSSDVAIMCFDCTKRVTLEALDDWSRELIEKGPPNLIKILVANKCDLEDQREVTKKEADDFAYKNQINHFAEVSAKTGAGVKELFIYIAENFATPQATGEVIEEDVPVAIDKAPLAKSSGGCC